MKKDRKSSKRWSRDDTELTLLAFPTFVWYVLFSFLPMFGIILAFKDYRIIQGESFLYSLWHSEFVGFKNFKFFIESNMMFILLRNTILYNILFIVLNIAIPVTLAIMINELHSKIKSKVYQTLMFFPYFMSWVVVSYIMYAFLNADGGIMNQIFLKLNLPKVNWYATPTFWPLILTITNVWKSVGYGMIVYLASITGIDKSYYEAAVVDGATKWQQIKFITLPLLKPIIVIMFILSVGKIFYTDFGLFFQVTRGIPGSLTNAVSTIDTYVYQALRVGTSIGMISAVTVFQSVSCCITVLIANYIVKKISPEDALI